MDLVSRLRNWHLFANDGHKNIVSKVLQIQRRVIIVLILWVINNVWAFQSHFLKLEPRF
jgi:hypothetical protein